jgi:exodeoxyribonuclease V gamma subunit
VADWTVWLEDLLSRSVARSDDNSHEHGAILTLLDRLRTAAVAAGFTRAIAFEAIRERVVAALEESPSPQAFLAGGVTFCQLVPLRAIPFRLVVITGLVDGGFPRNRAAAGFDLMARHSRAGDRTIRDDDRHLFLEALLSAREKLVLTVPARDLQNGQARPVSIVVSELLDAVAERFELAPLAAGDSPFAPPAASASDARSALRDWLVVVHPLQATSPRYFEADRDPRLGSRSERSYRAALARREALAAGVWTPRRFLGPEGSGRMAIRAAETSTESTAPTLNLDDLIERLLRSTRYFAREVLGLRLPRPEEVQGDLDPFELTHLEKASVGRGVFVDLAAGVPFERAVARMRANPALPEGFQGELLTRRLRAEAKAIAEIASARRAGERLPDLAFELELPARVDGSRPQLVGQLDQLWPMARIEAEFGRLGGNREVALWIRHLVLCALADRGHALPRESVGIGRPVSRDPSKRAERHPVVVFARVEAPLEILAPLFDRAWGVPEAPLPYFERASRAYAETCLAANEGSEAKAWRAARSVFEGRDDTGGRTAEAAQELDTMRVWEGGSPVEPAGDGALGIGFDELAVEIFGPLFNARSGLPE